MKRAMITIVTIIALCAAGSLLAGDAKPCKGDPDECLEKLKAKIAAKGWLGVETEKCEKGYFAVARVFEGSPAEMAGFEPGDVVVAVNGVPAGDRDAKKALKKTGMKPGAETTYVVKRDGQKVTLTATLGHVPDEVAATWIAEHMETHHNDTKVASK